MCIALYLCQNMLMSCTKGIPQMGIGLHMFAQINVENVRIVTGNL